MLNVAAAVIVKENKILITQRAKEDSFPLKWEFPGGKLEEGETPEECLKREITEELNLDIDVQNYLGSYAYPYETGDIRLIIYKAQIISGDMQLNVHNDAKWVTVNELKNYEFPPADTDLIEKLCREWRDQ
ncbi:MAG TPA: 8-oxo-dGTP diphosphatase MutT [Ruminiclostridium sp.]|nr:8-oxo-dGTP diphosphatase MutT [Ruminiclostridium sp.]